MAIFWNPINKPNTLPVLSSSAINSLSSPLKRKRGLGEIVCEESGGSSSQELRSSPLRDIVLRKRPARTVKILPTIEGRSPKKRKVQRTARVSGLGFPPTEKVRVVEGIDSRPTALRSNAAPSISSTTLQLEGPRLLPPKHQLPNHPPPPPLPQTSTLSPSSQSTRTPASPDPPSPGPKIAKLSPL
jgi:hypothetical protein